MHHTIPVSKEHENRRLGFEINIANIFNQHSAVGYYEFAIPANLVSPSRPSRFPGDPGVDWARVMKGYNYVDALNATGSFANVQAPLTLASRYGLPNLYQLARNMRLALRFSF